MSWFESVTPKAYGQAPSASPDAQQAALIQAGMMSPLWGLFYAATATGMAWWGMTRLMGLAAPERITANVIKLSLVKPEPVSTLAPQAQAPVVVEAPKPAPAAELKSEPVKAAAPEPKAEATTPAVAKPTPAAKAAAPVKVETPKAAPVKAVAKPAAVKTDAKPVAKSVAAKAEVKAPAPKAVAKPVVKKAPVRRG